MLKHLHEAFFLHEKRHEPTASLRGVGPTHDGACFVDVERLPDDRRLKGSPAWSVNARTCVSSESVGVPSLGAISVHAIAAAYRRIDTALGARYVPNRRNRELEIMAVVYRQQSSNGQLRWETITEFKEGNLCDGC
jgi:hypothetical protein